MGPMMGVIGGSGFYEIDGLSDVHAVEVDTPFGAPSDSIVLGTLGGTRIAFLPRHGVGHRILPSELPQRANIWALASLGVEHIISVSAVGSLREEIAPMHMVVPDQLIDRTHGRPSTFFGRGIAAHIAFDTPFCPVLSETLVASATGTGVTAHRGGTYVVMEGPAFSTRAESELHRSWGADIIGMTALPEAKLAREAGICYATLACVTDYDTWHAEHEAVNVEMILLNLRRNVANAKRIVAGVATALPARSCACKDALATAIVTPLDLVPEQVKHDLEPILARRLESRVRPEVTA
ncbi:MAG: S-methyl-5'-thioadenosine phosphorylase [Chloroflexi bacterium]|nr:S-methyl-5'-thioadenosine phosphorylase [Chloroflexota bacterium]